MRGCHEDEPRGGGGPGAGGDVQPFLVDPHRVDACAGPEGGAVGTRVAGVLEPDVVAGIEQQAAEHPEALRGAGDDEDLVRYAKALRLDLPRFVKEMEAHTYAERVREDFSSGVRSGVNGTPTFFINGARHDGPFDLGSLLAAIEEAA